MKKIKNLLLLSFLLLNSCDSNFYGDINLGSDFYYMVEPTFNEIVIPVNSKDPYKSSSPVIQNIQAIGYDKNYILATSGNNDSIKYWFIDKAKKKIELGYDNKSNLKLSNVNTIDSMKFYNFLKENKIELKERKYYLKESGYDN